MAGNALALLLVAGGAALLLGKKKKKKVEWTTEPTVTEEELEPDVPSPTGFDWETDVLPAWGEQFKTTFTRLESGVADVDGREMQWTVASADPPTEHGAYAGIFHFTDNGERGLGWGNNKPEAKAKLNIG